MRGLYKRGGKWYCSIVDARGRLIRKPLSTDKQTARNILGNMRKNIDLQKAGLIPLDTVEQQPVTDSMETIRTLYEKHLATLGRSEAFRKGFTSAWNSIFVHGGYKTLDQFDHKAVGKWIRKRLLRVKPQSINVFLSTMKGFYKWAVKEGYTTQNPLGDFHVLKATD